MKTLSDSSLFNNEILKTLPTEVAKIHGRGAASTHEIVKKEKEI